MANKMLIDTSHPEETRVVVLRGNRVEDFDFESASKKPLRGNIYLAKVTRVEPSLQAAFIEYGGNRHGFLAFSEIHPDYYQIPVADRQALLDEEARAHREEDDDSRSSHSHGQGNGRRTRRHRGGNRHGQSEKRADLGDATVSELVDATGPQPEAAYPDHDAERVEGSEPSSFAAGDSEPDTRDDSSEAGAVEQFEFAADPAPELDFGSAAEAAPVQAGATSDQPTVPEPAFATETPEIEAGDEPAEALQDSASQADPVDAAFHADESGVTDVMAEAHPGDDEAAHGEEEDEHVEQIGGDALEETTYRAPRLRRHYKIQEVIKRRQILLVQVVKEERGNKGAALTTYLSLAGRYSVLMPNTARGGGISRKITDADDRKRLKAIAQELDVPEGMGIILRTAGAARGVDEVKRDFEYLLRMWETVRETTLNSSAPKLVYEEGSLIKRTIRDLYSNEVDEIWVSGDAGFREARDYMRLLMPTHVKNVHAYKDPQPIFAKSGAEAQLDAMFSNHVTLKSGGYIVINQTEALVAIDVNSGRSTREHNIEDTAVRTNLEAADEVARQLRLRDLAGLIVVDFIDMEEGRNNRAVERRIKDALKNDRARIQIGRISHFGLLEMSRQRIRTGVLEGSTVICPHCAGAGTVRSTSSIALHVLRVLEDTLIRSATHNLIVRTRTEVALYILNQKRANLWSLEQRFGVSIVVMADHELTGTVYHAIERGEPATPPAFFPGQAAASDADLDEAEVEGLEDEVEEDEDAEAEVRADTDRRPAEGDDTGTGERKRKRRRRRRGRERDSRTLETASETGELLEGGTEPEFETDDLPEEPVSAESQPDEVEGRMIETPVEAPELEVSETGETQEEVAEPAPRRRSRRAGSRAAPAAGAEGSGATTARSSSRSGSDEGTSAPRRSRRSRARPTEEQVAPTSSEAAQAPSADLDIEADTAQSHPVDVAPASDAESTENRGLEELTLTPPEAAAAPEPAPAFAPEPEPVNEAPPAPEEPSRPKRSGWWQRAKATLTGE